MKSIDKLKFLLYDSNYHMEFFGILLGGYYLNFLINLFFITFLFQLFIVFYFVYSLFEFIFIQSKQGLKLNIKNLNK